MSGKVKRREALRRETEAMQRKQQAAQKQALLALGILIFAIACAIAAVGQWRAEKPVKSATLSASQIALPLTSHEWEAAGRPFAQIPVPTPWQPWRPSKDSSLPTIQDLVAMPEQRLGKVDIALVNLRCAESLPGSENLDIKATLAAIDEWAEHVRKETTRYAYLAREDAGRYGGSEARYKMDMLTTVLQQDFGIRYDDRIKSIPIGKEGDRTFFSKYVSNSRNLFLNGLTERKKGTCSSMPVLFVAVGRRLGYPLKLVRAYEHLYVQWNDGREKFNIEATSTGGLNSHPDGCYWHWPKPVSPHEAEELGLFKPLTRRQELAEFLTVHATCLGAIRCEALSLGWLSLALQADPDSVPCRKKSFERVRAYVKAETQRELINSFSGLVRQGILDYQWDDIIQEANRGAEELVRHAITHPIPL